MKEASSGARWGFVLRVVLASTKAGGQLLHPQLTHSGIVAEPGKSQHSSADDPHLRAPLCLARNLTPASATTGASSHGPSTNSSAPPRRLPGLRMSATDK